MKTLLTIIFITFASTAARSQSLCTYYLNKAHNYIIAGNHEQALYMAKKATKMYPDSSRCYLQRGGAYFFSDSLDQAYIDLEKYISMKPNDPRGYFWRGMVSFNSNVFGDAEEDFNSSLKLDPTSPDVPRYLAKTHFHQQKFKLAQKEFEHELEIDPTWAVGNSYLGSINENLKNYDLSLQYFTKAIDLDPVTMSHYYNRARVYMELGEKDKACTDWTTAARNGMPDAEMWLEIHNCGDQKGLNKADLSFDKVEQSKRKKGEKFTFTITADYFPMLPHARYTYQSDNEGVSQTAAMAVLYDDFESKDYYFDLWNDRGSGLDQLYFSLMQSDNFHFEDGKLDILKMDKDFNLVPIPLFPREFVCGAEQEIDNTWSPNLSYEIDNFGLTFEGFESLDLPAGKFEKCVKLRVLTRENNGRHTLAYLWLVKDFGLVKWRNNQGEVWEISRYAIPEYGSFPEEENVHLMPPPQEEIIMDEVIRSKPK